MLLMQVSFFCIVGTCREPSNSNATSRSMSAELFATLLKANSAGGPWDVETFWSDHLYFIPLITLEWRVWGVSETISMPLLRCNGVTCLWSNMCHCAVLPVKAFFLPSLSISNLLLICLWCVSRYMVIQDPGTDTTTLIKIVVVDFNLSSAWIFLVRFGESEEKTHFRRPAYLRWSWSDVLSCEKVKITLS